MNAWQNQLEEMKVEMKFWEVDEFINFYGKIQNTIMTNIESILNHRLTKDLGKIQTDISNKFNSHSPIFKQIEEKISDQNQAIVYNLRQFDLLPNEFKE
jgi:hypothetical protein